MKMYPNMHSTAFPQGVITLKICSIDMPSYTYAVKAKKLLASRGIKCDIKRRENTCGYALGIYGDCRSATEILDKYAVPYKNGGAS